jgi:hypothetical protein
MMTINDGGPAFLAVPVPTEADHKRARLERLRDEFAMAALTGMLIGEWLSDKGVATTAYEYADAMLRAREVKP